MTEIIFNFSLIEDIETGKLGKESISRTISNMPRDGGWGWVR